MILFLEESIMPVILPNGAFSIRTTKWWMNLHFGGQTLQRDTDRHLSRWHRPSIDQGILILSFNFNFGIPFSLLCTVQKSRRLESCSFFFCALSDTRLVLRDSSRVINSARSCLPIPTDAANHSPHERQYLLYEIPILSTTAGQRISNCRARQ